MPRRPTDIDRNAISLLDQADLGKITVKEALVALGVSEKQASKGWAIVKARSALRSALAVAREERLKGFVAADSTPGVDQEMAMINARLRSNILNGEDKGVQSAKLLGSRKDLNMWTADSLTGVFLIEVPKNLPALPEGSGSD